MIGHVHVTSDAGAGRRRVALVATAGVFGLAFLALALVVGGGPLPIDLTVAVALQPLRFGVIGSLVAAVNLLGQPFVWDALVAVIAIALWLRGRRFEAILLVVGVVGVEAGASLAKIVVGRVRPPGIAVGDLITQASFPSGHMVRTVVTTGLLAAMAWPRRRWRRAAAVAAVAFSVVMGIARIAVGEHWFTDIVGAALFGSWALAVLGIIAMIARPAFERRFGARGRAPG
jgi:membrane-associated phospholipid phosphatase